MERSETMRREALAATESGSRIDVWSDVGPSVRRARIAFFMEQQAGLGTHYANWRAAESAIGDLAEAAWIPITYYEPGGMIERLKFLPDGIRAVWRSYLQVDRALRNGPFDALLFNTHNPAVVHGRSVSANRAFLQFDVTPIQLDRQREYYSHPDNELAKGRLDRWKARRVRDTFQRAAGLLPWSTWAARSAIEDYEVPSERVHVIPPGVDTNRWRPVEERREDGVVRVLFTGGQFRRKGGDLLLRWAGETTRRGWELHLVTRDSLEPMPNAVVHNDMGPNSPELVALTQRCDLFVLPTRADCFSLAALEAMACGLPAIITDAGGIPDIVTAGETGRLVPVDDYDALAHALDQFVGDESLRRAMGARAREVVCQRFDAQKTLRAAVERMLAA